MFGLSGTPTLPDGRWLLNMLVLLGLLALMLYSVRGSRAERTERLIRHRSRAARLALGAVIVFILWFAMVFILGAGPVVRAFVAD